MISVVVDTNVLVSAPRSNEGASFRLLTLVGVDAPFRPIVSVPLVLEYEAAMKRVEGIRPEDVDGIIDFLCQVGDRREIYYLWRPFLKDPKDEMVLEVAVGGRARAIVTHNARDFEGVRGQFGIDVMRPAQFLLWLEEGKKS